MTDETNHTSSFGYDSRMQVNHFEISGSVVSQNYDYYNDGRIRFVDNLTDANFDRSYSYDHDARLTMVGSGGAANQTSEAVPYWETFAYDALGHTTHRFTEAWSQDDYLDVASYLNERRTGWGYDADGRLKTIETRQYNYDAAGQTELMTGQVWGGLGYYAASTANGFDGDGNRVKEVSTTPLGSLTTHYLRSTVLGGAIVKEINSAGQTIGYVRTPDGQLLTTQQNGPIWKHQAPLGTGQFSTGLGEGFSRIEFDPVGADVALTAPPPHSGGGQDGDLRDGLGGSPADSRFSDLTNPAAGCMGMMDGMPGPCIMGGSLGRGSLSWLLDVQRVTKVGPGALLRWVPPKRRHNFDIPNPFDPEDGPVVKTSNSMVPGYWEPIDIGGGTTSFGGVAPQNPDSKGIKKLVDEALAKTPCVEFSKRILNAVSSKRNPALEGGDLAKIFTLFLKKGGQYTRTLPRGSAGWGNPIGLIPAGAKIAMASFPDPALQTWSDAVVTIDELFHLGGSKAWYDDYELANKAHGIPEYAAQMSLSAKNNVFDPKYTGNAKDRYSGGYSSYFHNVTRAFCPVAKP